MRIVKILMTNLPNSSLFHSVLVAWATNVFLKKRKKRRKIQEGKPIVVIRQYNPTFNKTKKPFKYTRIQRKLSLRRKYRNQVIVKCAR